MSRINTRNYQLGLAFNDGDLRKPKHDEIMHWLSSWVQDPENARPFYAPKQISRTISKSHRLNAEASTALRALKDHERESTLRSFQGRFAWHEERDVKQVWPDEPHRELKFRKLQWELPLKDQRGGLVGFCDLCADFDATCSLDKTLVSLYSATPPTDRHRSGWNFELSGTTEEWRQQSGEVRIFFEVKTEIPSVGELMRQLQLYRTTETIRGYWNHLVVVAPPNNEAASVCEAHGIAFVPYRPN